MKTLPSKELLSATWGSEVTDIDNTTDIKWDMDVLGFWAYNKRGVLKRYYISIHELAHKVKEWANPTETKKIIIDGIQSGSNNAGTYYCHIRGSFLDEDGDATDEEFPISFIADTEPEAIFKAGEHILKEISK